MLGSIGRGKRKVSELVLDNGRSIRLTADHLVQTRRGWVAAGDLERTDVVLCVPTIGPEEQPYELPAPLIRLLAYVSGDGHLTSNGKRVSIYTTVEEDAAALNRDLRALGYAPRTYRRERGSSRRTEIHVCVGSRKFHRQLVDLGSPVGKKRWAELPMRWILDAPHSVRAQFLSAFASAEMSSPRLAGACAANLAIKQADANAARFVTELLTSLGFAASLAPSANQWVVQISRR
jgi:intein/homing endonuclease